MSKEGLIHTFDIYLENCSTRMLTKIIRQQFKALKKICNARTYTLLHWNKMLTNIIRQQYIC